MTNNNLPPPSRPTIEKLKADLSVYIGYPKCMDCKWKSGTPLTDNCSCDPRNTNPDKWVEHKAHYLRARELQDRLIEAIGVKGYHAWEAEEDRKWRERSK